MPVARLDVVDTQSLSCDTLPDALKSMCNILRIQKKTLDDIAELALDPNLPPTYFVIVGDHKPPLLLRDSARAYSADRVPMLLLNPIL